MSNLIKPYTIAVYEEQLTGDSFVEKRLGIIGSDEMIDFGRALEPTLITNVNGQTTFSFKMYKRYVDPITGEDVENPYVDWLINERKVKLQYDNQWYDFIIKNINENSSNYLYTYSLEEEFVQELSKNGFGVTLDESLNNNLGNAKTLATRVLDGSDWEVESEVFIQTVEEALVYITIPAGTKVRRVRDRADLEHGVTIDDEASLSDDQAVEALAFYSSCTNKPHRFQFIYLNDYTAGNVAVDENRVINVKDCQYIIDIPSPDKYKQVSASGYTNYWLPNLSENGTGEGFKLEIKTGSSTSDSTLSTLYRGARYGFSQQVEYIPLLDRYCNKYTKDGKNYYGYVDNIYNSPVLLQNVITNSEFKGTSGWLGTYIGETANVSKLYSTKLTSEYGRFSKGEFVSVIDDLEDAIDIEKQNYKSFLRMEFQDDSKASVSGAVINSGFYDNRISIKQVNYNEEWIFNLKLCKNNGTLITKADNPFSFKLQGAYYNQRTGGYLLEKIWAEIDEDKITSNNDGLHCEFKFNKVYQNMTDEEKAKYADVGISEKDFKLTNVKLVITRKNSGAAETFFIENIELYKKHIYQKDGVDKVMKLGDPQLEGAVINTYSFFPADALKTDDATKIALEQSETLDHTLYVPVYNDNAEQIRPIQVKESNYFNNLQTIAETFEAWMLIRPIRDSATGAVTKKQIYFKNYVGDKNYASFRYGVNLKDIQRTYESKNIVTKLVVKQNKNEHAPNGFCSIARANSNTTGEDYIYDFQYYHKQELLDSSNYLDLVYDLTGAKGDDIPSTTGWNLQGYFPRVKELNNKIHPLGEEIGGLQLDLNELEAEKAVAQAAYDAAAAGVQQTQEDFYSMTGGLMPTQISQKAFSSITCEMPDVDDDDKEVEDGVLGTNILNSNNEWAQDATVSVTHAEDSKVDWTFTVNLADKTKPLNGMEPLDSDFATYGTPTWDGDNLIIDANAQDYSGIYLQKWNTIGTAYQTYEVNNRYWLEYYIRQNYSQEGENITLSPGQLTHIGGHSTSFKDYSVVVDKYQEYNDLDGTQHSKHLGTYRSADGENVVALPKVEGEDLSKIYYKVVVSGVFIKVDNDEYPYLFIQPNRGQTGESIQVSCKVSDILIYEEVANITSRERTFKLQPIFTLIPNVEEGVTPQSIIQAPILNCTIPIYQKTGTLTYKLPIVDLDNTKIADLLKQYGTYKEEFNKARDQLEGNSEENIIGLNTQIANQEQAIKDKETERDSLLGQKKKLHSMFYKKYARFIQEGTWVNEEYVDHEKYYADAQSVLYNSCYPQAAYSINVLELSKLPGYEMFTFNLGDETYVEDPDFFGSDLREKVIISAITSRLDDPSKNSIKVQNFKNQFQDLFQKITATVQQAQYNEGAYKKSSALAEANAEKKNKFLTDALSLASAKLTVGNQKTVTSDTEGITITDETTQEKLRLLGGVILMSTKDEKTGEDVWKTGVTPQGISADLVTAGTINTANISIMNSSDEVFKWDAYGLSAFDTAWSNGEIVSQPNKNKFVRFDKYGLYGMSTSSDGTVTMDGFSWHPASLDEINRYATFSLSWDGLKVTGNGNIVARLGKTDKDIFNISKEGKELLTFSNDGTLKVGSWTVSQDGLEGPTYEDQEASVSTYAMRRARVKKSEPSVFLQPKGRLALVENFTNTTGQTDSIVFKAGDNFMVSQDGALYAKAGIIGNMQIGDIASKTQPINENLLAGTAIPDETILNYASGEAYQPTWHEHNGKNFKYHAYNIYHLIDSNNIPSLFKVNDLITISFQWSFIQNAIASDNSTYPFFVIECGNGSTGIPWNWGELVNTNGDRWEGDETKARFSISEEKTSGFAWATIKITEQTLQEALKSLRIRVDGPEDKNTDKLIISNAKLERGNVFTAWSEAIGESTVSSNVNTNDFSWKFSPTEGMFMWNGAQGTGDSGKNANGSYKDDNLVFKVGPKSGGGNELYMRGHIEATSGKIGSLTITQVEGLPSDISAAQAAATEVANSKMSPSVTTGSYCWTFNSTNGITMTSGGTEVFKVGNIDGQNALKIKGRIESDSGYIGSWSLGQFSLKVNDTTWTGKGIYYEGSTSGLGRTIVSPGQIHFATSDAMEQQEFTFFSGGGGVYGYFNIHGATMTGSYALDRDLSDVRMKNSIEQLSNQYEVFFDFMEPARYKYNNGTSDRYHVGFIAQQLVDSLNKSGLSTQDFAGMMLRHPGQEDECWYLRHNEFVALNTWQIQKLKPRVSTLEQTILNYEARISNLEAEIQNLKSS